MVRYIFAILLLIFVSQIAYSADKGESKLLCFIAQNLGILCGVLFLAIATRAIIKRTKRSKKGQNVLDRSNNMESDTLHPLMDPKLCIGCGSCVLACPEEDVLRIVEHKSRLASPTKCIGCGRCSLNCPKNGITLVYGSRDYGVKLPKLSENLEANIDGLYITGELSGTVLIANSLKDGVKAATHAISSLKKNEGMYDLIIVGAGPAGIAAALKAKSMKKRYLWIERDKLGGLINKYPNKKIVTLAKHTLPIIGRKKFRKNSVLKEDLLLYWQSIYNKAKLKVSEKTTFISFEKTLDHFVVQTSKGSFESQKLILAIGTKGNPKKSTLVKKVLKNINYELKYPERFKGKRILVVGSGNSAAEAAALLANKNYVTLLCRRSFLTRCNLTNENKIKDLVAVDRMKVIYNTNFIRVDKKNLTIEADNRVRDLKFDDLFFFIGYEKPMNELEKMGITTHTYHGTNLSEGEINV